MMLTLFSVILILIDIFVFDKRLREFEKILYEFDKRIEKLEVKENEIGAE